MILSTIDDSNYTIKLDHDVNNINLKINVSKIIVEYQNKTIIYYKIFLNNSFNLQYDNKYVNQIDKILYDLLNINKNLPVIVEKNKLSDIIIEYLLMDDFDIKIDFINCDKIKKRLIIFLFYLNDEKIILYSKNLPVL